VQPPTEGVAPSQPSPPPPEEAPSADIDFLSQLHPIIAGLVRMLPRSDDKWSADEQKAWLHVAQVNFAFLYGDPQETSSTLGAHTNEGGPQRTSTNAHADGGRGSTPAAELDR
jgi:hypothetical protein